jgi:hypothetical protein
VFVVMVAVPSVDARGQEHRTRKTRTVLPLPHGPGSSTALKRR